MMYESSTLSTRTGATSTFTPFADDAPNTAHQCPSCNVIFWESLATGDYVYHDDECTNEEDELPPAPCRLLTATVKAHRLAATARQARQDFSRRRPR